MSAKKVYLPMRPHLVKFAKKEYTWKNGYLNLTKKRLLRPATITPRNYQDYFKRQSEKEEMIMVPAITIDSRLYKLYYFIQNLDHRFNEKMCDFIEVRVLPPVNIPAMESVRQYLSMYSITESEYSMHTAYKRWQRSDQYKKIKEYEFYSQKQSG